jgi:hypothetical protein
VKKQGFKISVKHCQRFSHRRLQNLLTWSQAENSFATSPKTGVCGQLAAIKNFGRFHVWNQRDVVDF